MSDEFDHNPENSFSSFWPLLILVGGFFIWFAYQDYALNKQRSFYQQQVEAAGTTIEAANNWHERYGAMLKDLNEISAKDTYAAAILKDAVQAGVQNGLIHLQQGGTNSAATPAAPTK